MQRTLLLVLVLLALAPPALGQIDQGMVPAATYTLDAARTAATPLGTGEVQTIDVQVTRSCPLSTVRQQEATVPLDIRTSHPQLAVMGALQVVFPEQICIQSASHTVVHPLEIALSGPTNATIASVVVTAQPPPSFTSGFRTGISDEVAVPLNASMPVVEEPSVLQAKSQDAPGAGPMVLVALAAMGAAIRRR